MATKKPKPSATKAKAAAMVAAIAPQEWLDHADRTVMELLEELRSRRAELKPLELIGAVRAITDATTAARALAPGADEDP